MDDDFLAREKCVLGRLDNSIGRVVNAKWKENYSRPYTEGLLFAFATDLTYA